MESLSLMFLGPETGLPCAGRHPGRQSPIEHGLSSAGDVDSRTFVGEQLGHSEPEAGATAVTTAIFPSSFDISASFITDWTHPQARNRSQSWTAADDILE
jgi:hypothetical protein